MPGVVYGVGRRALHYRLKQCICVVCGLTIAGVFFQPPVYRGRRDVHQAHFSECRQQVVFQQFATLDFRTGRGFGAVRPAPRLDPFWRVLAERDRFAPALCLALAEGRPRAGVDKTFLCTQPAVRHRLIVKILILAGGYARMRGERFHWGRVGRLKILAPVPVCFGLDLAETTPARLASHANLPSSGAVKRYRSST